MSAPSNAREALIAELVGEVSSLLDRVDNLVPEIHATCDAIVRAGTELEAHASQAERRISAFTEAAKAHAVKHIAQRTDELARSSSEAQLQAMRQTAREVARAEVAPALQQMQRRQLARAAGIGSADRLWTYAATAICAAVVGAAAAAYVLSVSAP